MKLEQYNSMCGLSQNEFRRYLELRKQYWGRKQQLSKFDLEYMIECLEAIAEHQANQIEDLLEEIG